MTPPSPSFLNRLLGLTSEMALKSGLYLSSPRDQQDQPAAVSDRIVLFVFLYLEYYISFTLRLLSSSPPLIIK